MADVPRDVIEPRVDLLKSDFPLVIALSGGVDSTALALCVRSRFPAESVVAAHFNHRTRDARDHESDELAVRRLCEHIGVPLILGQASPKDASAGGPEHLAREQRYAFLETAARMCRARSIATAHHADDQIETILMRLMAGADGSTLAGVPARRKTADGLSIVRPLINARRCDLEALVRRTRVEWREDVTNSDTRLRRNLVRREVLPALESLWPAIRNDMLVLGRGMQTVRSRSTDSCDDALGESQVSSTAVRVRVGVFRSLDDDARLEFLYRVMRLVGALKRSDRPSHRFFAPLLAASYPAGGDFGSHGRRGTILGGRGIVVRAEREMLIVERNCPGR